jgi:TusA-related sulfurtransferase
MKKLLALVVVIALLGVSGTVLACEGAGACPMKVKGAKIEVKNVDKGVTITITAGDAAAVKEIQEKAVKIKDGCPCMKEGKEHGKCPHAGEKGACGDGQSTESKCPHAK